MSATPAETARVDTPCPECAGPPVPGHFFCEACGRSLRSSAWRSSTAPPGPCECGGTDLSGEGYCEDCGRRRPVGQAHVELELPGVAAVTDRGHRKQRNEDAVAIGRVDAAGPAGVVVAAVVSDGVSASDRADEAAHASVDTAMAALLETIHSGGTPAEATVAAARAAAAAVAALVGPDPAGSPPSCTYVSAVVTPAEVVVGWIGDSRAYWLGESPEPSRALSSDDSPAGSSAITRWLGADADGTEPRVSTFRPAGPGRVLLCSDGLSRYLSDPAGLAATAPGAPADTARALNQLSLDAGGVDNIAIVIIPFPPVPEES